LKSNELLVHTNNQYTTMDTVRHNRNRHTSRHCQTNSVVCSKRNGRPRKKIMQQNLFTLGSCAGNGANVLPAKILRD